MERTRIVHHSVFIELVYEETTFAGSRMAKVEPAPDLLSTVMSPPII